MLVVLCSSLQLGLEGSNYQVLEFFAGRARIARLARSIGLRSGALDASYDRNLHSAMNINTASGFVSNP